MCAQPPSAARKNAFHLTARAVAPTVPPLRIHISVIFETVLIMKLNAKSLESLVAAFLTEMHRYDAGRTLPLLHAAQLTTPQLAVLEFVHRPRTVSGVADHVGLSRPATSQMINKLVQRRLVRRSEGQSDRRQKAVVLTAQGEQLLARVSAARIRRFQASLARLSAPVASCLEEALVRVVAELREERPSFSGRHQKVGHA